MSDDVTWNIVGNKILLGKDAVKSMLISMEGDIATELIINALINHGDTAAADGVMKFAANTIAFCDVYKFNGHAKDAKIKELTSYGIELK